MSRAMQFDIVANDKATESMKKVENASGRFADKLGMQFTKIAAKAAIVLATIQKMGKVFSEGVDIERMSKRMGVTMEAFQRFDAVAKDFDTSPEELIGGFKELNKLLDEAATKGKGPKFEALKALGFSDQEIMNREIKHMEILKRLAEAMAEVSEEQQKMAIAKRVLGEEPSMKLKPILDNFDEAMEVFNNASVMTDEQVRNLRAVDRTINSVTQTATKLAQGAMANVFGAAGAGDEPKPQKAADAEAAARAAALLAVGSEKDKGKVEKTGGLAVTSLQQIGGGIARGPSALENYAARTAVATETMAGQLRTTPPPATSSTDITKPSIPGRVIASVGNVLKEGLPKVPTTPIRPAR